MKGRERDIGWSKRGREARVHSEHSTARKKGKGNTGFKEKKNQRTIRRAFKGVEAIRFVLQKRRRMVRE